MTAPETPAERFASIIRCLCKAVAEMRGGDRLSHYLISLIVERLRPINQCFARIAARVAAGTFVPRRSAPRRKPAAPRPRPPSKLPRQRGWLVALLPTANANAYRAQLENLLRDPEMAALLATAPESLRRPVRSLCWMLRVSPPPLLAPPPKPRQPRKPPAPKTPAAKTPPPPQLELPAWMRLGPDRKPWSKTRMCGPPRRA